MSKSKKDGRELPIRRENISHMDAAKWYRTSYDDTELGFSVVVTGHRTKQDAAFWHYEDEEEPQPELPPAGTTYYLGDSHSGSIYTDYTVLMDAIYADSRRRGIIEDRLAARAALARQSIQREGN